MELRKGCYILFLFTILGCSCNNKTLLVQGVFSKAGTQVNPTICAVVDVQLPGNSFNIYACPSEPNSFYFVPSRLVIERGSANDPIAFIQWLSKKQVNILINVTFDTKEYIDAYNFLKGINSQYNLQLLPIVNSKIFKATSLSIRNSYVDGTSSSNYFKGWVIIQVKGDIEIGQIRQALYSGSSGIMMSYYCEFLKQTQTPNVVERFSKEIPIELINLSF